MKKIKVKGPRFKRVETDARTEAIALPVVLTWSRTSHPEVIWEERVALAQLRNKMPVGYNGTLQIHA